MTNSRSGLFGDFGGSYVPDTLLTALTDLEQSFEIAKADSDFCNELKYYLSTYVGRPTALTHAKRISAELGATIYLKREDLNHTGAHKINNTIGQVLLAKRLGKKRIIAETGAGQHGVATATAASLFGLECVIYMGKKDVERQSLNVYRMQLLGATVKAVESGSMTLKDATTEAIRDWLASVDTTHFIIGSAVGPHPYPSIVKYFQSVIGSESKDQLRDSHGALPDVVVACVGGGSNAIGMFDAFVSDESVELIAVEAAGRGLDSGAHSASLSFGQPGVLHGSKSLVLQDDRGQIKLAHSVSAGLDYPGVGPELAYLKSTGRLTSVAVTDEDALDACHWLSKQEGIIPALETAHALAYLRQVSGYLANKVVLVNLSGRGDKDMETIREFDSQRI